MKSCKKCGQLKSIGDFYKNMATCKLCYCEKMRIDRINNPEVFRERDAKRAMNPERVAARERYIKTESGKAAKKRATKKWVEKSTIKRAAHILIGNRLRDGKITKQPCEVCGSTYRIHAHHDDYAKPLDVRWLCSAHHSQWHKANGEAKNAR
jgi:hypothetical protein